MKKKRKNKFLFCTIIGLCLLIFTHVALEAVDNTFLDDENMIEISNDLKAGNTEVALEKLDKLIEEDPEYENALTLRAYWNVLTSQNSEQVMKDIKAISQIQENPAKIYEDMTYLCYDNKKFEQAWNLVDYALPLFSESYNLHVARGLLEMEEDNLENAIVYYKKALEIKPDYAYALIEITDAYIEKKDYEKALAITDKMIQYNPDSHLAYHRRY
ncbi:MAG: tetratricopeptide repeat protein, partial [Candidatus Cloacimonetes bacterium]|nr:tetratricopeptide repeat protein [Candidatus Cloacimonadota bacterium]